MDPFTLYDYLLDRDTADDMGFETVEELYNHISEMRTKNGIEGINQQGTRTDDIRSNQRND